VTSNIINDIIIFFIGFYFYEFIPFLLKTPRFGDHKQLVINGYCG